MDDKNLMLFRYLATKFPNTQSVVSEIINLEAILRLPKGTEHFLSDIHGEYEAFCHILNNCSGVIREKVDALYQNSLTSTDKAELATTIYYPRQKIAALKAKFTKEGKDVNEWFLVLLHQLLDVSKSVGSKYTRSKVRKAMPADYAYIIDELLHADKSQEDKKQYYNEIIATIIGLGHAERFIEALCQLIKRLAVDSLHIIGDIYDRGSNPDLILDLLINHHNVDIQWGNHDILWLGASAGSFACIANALNISLVYGNMDLLETGYGINLRPLALFAEKHYTSGKLFRPKGSAEMPHSTSELTAKMRKALFVLMFKEEGEVIKRNPQFNMDDRLVLNNINFKSKTYNINGKTYKLLDCEFPTIDPSDPYKMTDEEKELVSSLAKSFTSSIRLQRHMKFLLDRGSLYKVVNDNLLFHGCIPLNDDGSFASIKAGEREFKGRELMDYCDAQVRTAYGKNSENKQAALDFVWYLWCGKFSPVFCRDRITTFERQFIFEPETHTEPKNHYYDYVGKYGVEQILAEFGLAGEYCHIINGHIPVLSSKGENPIKAGGKLVVIDGGFCRAYQSKTGIAGYTLIYNSHGLKLLAHESFTTIEHSIKANSDIHSQVTLFERASERIKVSDTDIGRDLKKQIETLKLLLRCYECGEIKES